MEIVKIKTKKGRFITLTVSSKNQTHIRGTDKFGADIILPINEIDTMFPLEINNG